MSEMIQLDYQTNNSRWGWSGIEFITWDEYVKVLGFLANEDHYRNMNGGRRSLWTDSIELHVEKNDKQGAWGKEGRIHYYGADTPIKVEFPELYACKSAGNNGITYRINSNDYMYSLVYDYRFKLKTYVGYTTADIFPPNNAYEVVWNIFENFANANGLNLRRLQEYYNLGWNL